MPNFKCYIDQWINTQYVRATAFDEIWYLVKWGDNFFAFKENPKREDYIGEGAYGRVAYAYAVDPNTGELNDKHDWVVKYYFPKRFDSFKELQNAIAVKQQFYQASDPIFISNMNQYIEISSYLGKSLKQVSEEKLTLPERIDLLLEVTMQLSQMHACTVNNKRTIHRDLNHRNIVFRKVPKYTYETSIPQKFGDINPTNYQYQKSTNTVLRSPQYTSKPSSIRPENKQFSHEEFLTSIIDFDLAKTSDSGFACFIKNARYNLYYFPLESVPDGYGNSYASDKTDIYMLVSVAISLLSSSNCYKDQQPKFPTENIEIDQSWNINQFNLRQCLINFLERMQNSVPHKRPAIEEVMNFFQLVSQYCHITQDAFLRKYYEQRLKAINAKLVLLSLGMWHQKIDYKNKQLKTFADFPFDRELEFCDFIVENAHSLTTTKLYAEFVCRYCLNKKFFISSAREFLAKQADEKQLEACVNLACLGWLTRKRIYKIVENRINDAGLQAISSLISVNQLTKKRLQTIENNQYSTNQLKACHFLIEHGLCTATWLDKIVPESTYHTNRYSRDLLAIMIYLVRAQSIYKSSDAYNFVNELANFDEGTLAILRNTMKSEFGVSDNWYQYHYHLKTFVFVLVNQSFNVSADMLTTLLDKSNSYRDLRGLSALVKSGQLNFREVERLWQNKNADFWHCIARLQRAKVLDKPHIISAKHILAFAHSKEKLQAIQILLKHHIHLTSWNVVNCANDSAVAKTYRAFVLYHIDDYSKDLEKQTKCLMDEGLNSFLQIWWGDQSVENLSPIKLDKCVDKLSSLSSNQKAILNDIHPDSIVNVRQKLIDYLCSNIASAYKSVVSSFKQGLSAQFDSTFAAGSLFPRECLVTALDWLLTVIESNNDSSQMYKALYEETDDYEMICNGENEHDSKQGPYRYTYKKQKLLNILNNDQSLKVDAPRHLLRLLKACYGAEKPNENKSRWANQWDTEKRGASAKQLLQHLQFREKDNNDDKKAIANCHSH